MSLTKAKFEVLDRQGRPGPAIPVQFNPTELSFAKSAQFAEIAVPGLDAPVLQYVRGNTETLSVELFFDTTDEGFEAEGTSVTERTDEFYKLAKQNPETHAPPVCRFSWGHRGSDAGTTQAGSAAGQPPGGASPASAEVSAAPFWFTCVVESVDRKFTLFSPAGVPVRARLTVKLREYKTLEQMVAELHSADHSKSRVLKRGQRLEQVSVAEYESPHEWRRIAEANGVDDPRRVRPGSLLVVPPVRPASVTRGGPRAGGR
jgi:hypothetical protein